MISAYQQYEHHADGTISIKGQPGITLDTIQEQGQVTARDIQAELGLPKYFEEWQELATPTGFSGRMVRFVLADESATRLQGNPRLQPRKITFPPTCYLEFGHRGFVIGALSEYYLCIEKGDLSTLGIEVPPHVEGACIIADAQLFSSRLADKAMEAIERGIFTHACPLLFRSLTEPLGMGHLVEVSLTTSDYPGCPGAKIIKTWHTPS